MKSLKTLDIPEKREVSLEFSRPHVFLELVRQFADSLPTPRTNRFPEQTARGDSKYDSRVSISLGLPVVKGTEARRGGGLILSPIYSGGGFRGQGGKLPPLEKNKVARTMIYLPTYLRGRPFGTAYRTV